MERFNISSAVVVAYNIPGCGTRLNLTRAQIVGMFNGTYRSWNDSTFQDINSACQMPNETIRVIVRGDKSGTTEIFTEGLTAFSDSWKAAYGTFSAGLKTNTNHEVPEKWDPGTIYLYGQNTGGMAGLIMSIKYSVGYLSVADASNYEIQYARVQNKQGIHVNPTIKAVQSAMDYAAERTQSLMTTLTDGDNPEAYPMAGYTYFIVYMHTMKDCDSAKELVRYIDWFMNTPEPRTACEDSKMTPLSKILIDRITSQVLKKMTCNGNNVWEMVEAEKASEVKVDETWVVPVAVTTPLFLLITFILLGYIIRQKLRMNAMIDKNEWDIPIEDIVFYFDEKGTSGGKSNLLGMKSIKSFKSIEDIPDGSDILLQILQWPGKYKGNTIGLRLLEIKELKLINREMKKDMLWMRDHLHHINVVRFFGLTELDEERYVISEYCSKGPMTEVLKDEKYNLNNDFKFSLAFDITAGMSFLHGSGIIHGHLSSSHCFIDSRWTVKIGDWEYLRLLQPIDKRKNPLTYIHKTSDDIDKQAAAFQQFWVAPEVLRSHLELQSAPNSDVYSFAIILQEIFTREDPYAELVDIFMPEQVIKAVVDNGLRPQPSEDTPIRVRQIMEIAWSETVVSRPSFDQISKMLRQCRPSRKSVLDSMMQTMEEYTSHLESRIEERTSEIFVVKSNIQNMLKDVIPPHLIYKITNGQCIETTVHAMLGVVLVELVNMGDLVDNSSAQDIVVYLNDTHNELEKIFNRYDAYRTDLQGDTFSVTLGLKKEIKNDNKRVEEIPHLCLDIFNIKNKIHCPANFYQPFELAISAHVGSAVTGVLGTASPKFVTLGKTMELLKHLSKRATSQKCLLSQAVHSLLDNPSTFDLTEAGSISFEDQIIQTYWLTGRHCTFVDISSNTSTDSGIDPDKIRPSSRESIKSQDSAIVEEPNKQTLELKENSKWINKSTNSGSTKRKNFKSDFTEKPSLFRTSKNNKITPVIEELTEL